MGVSTPPARLVLDIRRKIAEPKNVPDPFTEPEEATKKAAAAGVNPRPPGHGRTDAMISFSRISKQYGRQVLFVDASFQLNPGEKVGLVGPNGAGKTTLFRMIVGEEAPDEGEVSVPKKLDDRLLPPGRRGDVGPLGARRGDRRQRPRSATCTTSSRPCSTRWPTRRGPDEMDAILARFGEVQEEYDHLGGYALEAQAREVLHGLGFDDERIDGDVGALSGGWKMRVAMARVLLGRPDVLLMDEPTNHLDIESILWLEAFLKSLPGRAAHDLPRPRVHEPRRHARSPRSTAARSPPTRATTTSTSASGRIREANREAAYARQQAMLAKEQRFIERFAAHAAKAAQVQSRVKALEKIEKIELPKKRAGRAASTSASRRARATRWRRSRASARPTAAASSTTGSACTIRRGERWCVMGKNGAGKTTLLQDGRGRARARRGRRCRLGASLKMGYFAQQALDLLDPDLTVWEQMQKDFPHESDRRAAEPRSAPSSSRATTSTRRSARSRAARSRAWCMARMLLDPPNFLVLDEPTNHLDLATKEMLVEALQRLRGDDALRLARPRRSCAASATACSSWAARAAPSAQPHVYPGSYVEYVARTGHEAPGVHA